MPIGYTTRRNLHGNDDLYHNNNFSSHVYDLSNLSPDEKTTSESKEKN
jgi:hypothetical protein